MERTNRKNEELIQEFNVQEIPYTIYYLAHSNTPYVYNGKRTKEDILSYLSQKQHKIHYSIEVEELKDSLIENFNLEGLILGVFNGENKDEIQSFIDFSYENAHLYKFGIMNYTKDMEEEMNITGPAIVACKAPTLIALNNEYYASISNYSSLNLSEWLRKNFHPHITLQTKDREHTLMRTKHPLSQFS